VSFFFFFFYFSNESQKALIVPTPIKKVIKFAKLSEKTDNKL